MMARITQVRAAPGIIESDVTTGHWPHYSSGCSLPRSHWKLFRFPSLQCSTRMIVVLCLQQTNSACRFRRRFWGLGSHAHTLYKSSMGCNHRISLMLSILVEHLNSGFVIFLARNDTGTSETWGNKKAAGS